jgi:hypothetical protein
LPLFQFISATTPLLFLFIVSFGFSPSSSSSSIAAAPSSSLPLAAYPKLKPNYQAEWHRVHFNRDCSMFYSIIPSRDAI